MPPKELIVGLIVFAVVVFKISTNSFSKKKKHYRSLVSPVASNAELFDAFSSPSELNTNKEETENKSENSN